MAPEFNTSAVVANILNELGYSQHNTNWVSDALKHKEYVVHDRFVKFRTSYGTAGHKRFCILRINGKQVHVHGSEVSCSFIDLADPGSLDALRNAIISSEEPNGNTGKS